MQIDPNFGRKDRSRGPWVQLLSAVLGLAGSQAQLLRHAEKPWASATFSGARHTIALVFAGGEGAAAGEAFVAALPDHEFALPRHIVADAAISSVEHTLEGGPRMTVEAEFLLLEEE